jgi:hypothetical protein
MPTQTFTLPEPPKIPSGKEIYDSIMAKIEPELVSQNLPSLKEKYERENPEERGIRGKRYKAAYKKYDAAFKAYIADLERKVNTYRREALKSAEARDRENELSSLEALLA